MMKMKRVIGDCDGKVVIKALEDFGVLSSSLVIWR